MFPLLDIYKEDDSCLHGRRLPPERHRSHLNQLWSTECVCVRVWLGANVKCFSQTWQDIGRRKFLTSASRIARFSLEFVLNFFPSVETFRLASRCNRIRSKHLETVNSNSLTSVRFSWVDRPAPFVWPTIPYEPNLRVVRRVLNWIPTRKTPAFELNVPYSNRCTCVNCWSNNKSKPAYVLIEFRARTLFNDCTIVANDCDPISTSTRNWSVSKSSGCCWPASWTIWKPIWTNRDTNGWKSRGTSWNRMYANDWTSWRWNAATTSDNCLVSDFISVYVLLIIIGLRLICDRFAIICHRHPEWTQWRTNEFGDKRQFSTHRHRWSLQCIWRSTGSRI